MKTPSPEEHLAEPGEVRRRPVGALTTERLLGTIQDLVDFAPRATGTPGGKLAADYVAERFSRAGIADVRVLEEPSYLWKAERASLLVDDEAIACSPIQHCGVTWEGQTGDLINARLSGKVVDIGAGPVPADLRGMIVLFDLVFEVRLKSMNLLAEYRYDPRRVQKDRKVRDSRNPFQTSMLRVLRAAEKAGAVGVVGVLRDYPESLAYRNESFPEEPMGLPGVWVTLETGRALRARLQADSTATLDMHVTQERVLSQSVIGILPGRTSATVMIQSHHDSVTPGAVEDASGTAEVIALAEHFAAMDTDGRTREKTLMFVTFDTHFTGYQAHRRFAEEYLLATQLEFDVMLNATIEHVGLRAERGQDGQFRALPHSEPRGIFENLSLRWKWRLARLIRKNDLDGTSLLFGTALEFTEDGIPTDAAYTMSLGIPTISLISGPLYLYDDEDTIDKIDVDQLSPVANFFADIVEAADSASPNWIGLIPRPLRRLLPRWRW
ncbi:M28 family peptidase [Microbacterium sp. NPDC089698]|uniref:M28 family peptidase n=1 Tax=Microbacterium sp. NPDC089698 TaxID=3364200 RepID=UPI003812C288